jgi:hypothetical protein
MLPPYRQRYFPLTGSAIQQCYTGDVNSKYTVRQFLLRLLTDSTDGVLSITIWAPYPPRPFYAQNPMKFSIATLS